MTNEKDQNQNLPPYICHPGNRECDALGHFHSRSAERAGVKKQPDYVPWICSPDNPECDALGHFHSGH